jgi:hypothetical protein
MEIVSGRKFLNEEVVLDGNDCRHCTFSGSKLVSLVKNPANPFR